MAQRNPFRARAPKQPKRARLDFDEPWVRGELGVGVAVVPVSASLSPSSSSSPPPPPPSAPEAPEAAATKTEVKDVVVSGSTEKALQGPAAAVSAAATRVPSVPLTTGDNAPVSSLETSRQSSVPGHNQPRATFVAPASPPPPAASPPGSTPGTPELFGPSQRQFAPPRHSPRRSPRHSPLRRPTERNRPVPVPSGATGPRVTLSARLSSPEQRPAQSRINPHLQNISPVSRQFALHEQRMQALSQRTATVEDVKASKPFGSEHGADNSHANAPSQTQVQGRPRSWLALLFLSTVPPHLMTLALVLLEHGESALADPSTDHLTMSWLSSGLDPRLMNSVQLSSSVDMPNVTHDRDTAVNAVLRRLGGCPTEDASLATALLQASHTYAFPPLDELQSADDKEPAPTSALGSAAVVYGADSIHALGNLLLNRHYLSDSAIKQTIPPRLVADVPFLHAQLQLPTLTYRESAMSGDASKTRRSRKIPATITMQGFFTPMAWLRYETYRSWLVAERRALPFPH
ncbi:uncharacterized protein MONBRDRAFT_39085 [Monosiga brevicollis MX1]|uniref:Uncharacterized protein n=1 Tax=Monosiga brevicollis TaxID=81824 RepID=A9VC40_MONBE|nr:uncharacterized protein MONBRDRAFT_39085 [Monosiga brevicollis MX1]EDQ84956.1 predicted protein [Monosiga brevicollis MX1]|eukprot:XP_001750297.1 hypothetical protein [Monosiga brevicollis MX1]